MAYMNFLQKSEKFEIEEYKEPTDYKTIRKTHIAYTGSPKKHPYDPKKVILLADPFSDNTYFMEFRSEDISYLEKLPNIVNLNGETVTMVRFWVKMNSVGLRCIPFRVNVTQVI